MIHSSVEYGRKGVSISGQLKLQRQQAIQQACNKQHQDMSIQQPHTLFPEEERHDVYHESLGTNHGGPAQKEVSDCIAEVIHQNIPT